PLVLRGVLRRRGTGRLGACLLRRAGGLRGRLILRCGRRVAEAGQRGQVHRVLVGELRRVAGRLRGGFLGRLLEGRFRGLLRRGVLGIGGRGEGGVGRMLERGFPGGGPGARAGVGGGRGPGRREAGRCRVRGGGAGL